MREVEVSPVYGFGWFATDGVTVDVPAEFTASVEEENTVLSGTVATGTYEGWTIQISARTSPWNGTVNVVLNNAESEVTGFATIPIEALPND